MWERSLLAFGRKADGVLFVWNLRTEIKGMVQRRNGPALGRNCTNRRGDRNLNRSTSSKPTFLRDRSTLTRTNGIHS